MIIDTPAGNKIALTNHVQDQMKERQLDPAVIGKAMDTVNSILSGKELRFTIGNKTYVAKKNRGMPVVITAWEN